MLAVLFLQLSSLTLLCISMSAISTLRFQICNYPGRTLNLSEYCPAENAEVFTVEFEKVMVMAELAEMAVL